MSPSIIAVSYLFHLYICCVVILIRSISQSIHLYDSKKTHYDVLGLTLSASQDDIRGAFIKLSKEASKLVIHIVLSILLPFRFNLSDFYLSPIGIF